LLLSQIYDLIERNTSSISYQLIELKQIYEIKKLMYMKYVRIWAELFMCFISFWFWEVSIWYF